MTVRFIIGRAGSGKTRACLNAIREELQAQPAGCPLLLLVPEQATFQTEYALVSTPGLKGFTRAHVLSFRRLAYRVLQEVGGAARLHLGDTGKRMLMRRLLEQYRERLKVFRRSVGQIGFADVVTRALGEIKTYCVDPEDLVSAVDTLRGRSDTGLLPDKLDDLHLLYSSLEDYLSDRFIDPDDYLNLLADSLGESRLVRESLIWVDGFSGFTPQEYRVLAALIRAAREVNITLCTGPGSLAVFIDETDPFYPIRETYDKICEIAARERVVVSTPLVLDNAAAGRFQNPGLARLEKHYFNYPAPSCSISTEGVVLAAAAGPRAEAEGVAREIIALCRDRGYRYREIIVLLRDLGTYDRLISSVFADYGIPVFIDQKRPVMHHPLVELVRSALEVIIKDWAYDPVFRFLKTDLTALSREEVDLLENYVLAHGIRGSRWTDAKPWDYRRRLTLEEDVEASEPEARELELINSIRRQAAATLSSFQQEFKRAQNVREMTAALFGLLDSLESPDRLESWSRRAEEDGRLEPAREHVQVWGGLIALLDQVVEALGDEELTTEEYAAVLDAGFESMRLGLIPPGLDQVVVGSLERSRSPEVKAAFIMGVNDGVLPARASDQGIFTEQDRERLQWAGLNLAPGGRRKVFDEQYLVYIALTRSSRRLYLSYSLTDEEGAARMPSPVVARVKELLPGVEERVWPVEPTGSLADDLEFVAGPGRTLSHLAARIREVKAGRQINQVWRDVYNWFARNRYKDCARVLSGIFYSNREARLPVPLTRALYGRALKTSVSGVEKFRACPFAHFLSKGLRLQERKIFKLDAPDLGQFFHAALKVFGERIEEKGLDWGKMPRELCREMAGEVVEQLAPRLSSEILLSSPRRRYLTGKLKRTVQRAALILAEHSRRGSFRPVGLELAFGPAGELPAVTFLLADGSEMILTGQIDRVDVAHGEGGVYLRVIDYKSGRVSINLSDIYHGLRLQLLAYLDVALENAAALAGGPAQPGAILYFRIDDPLIKTDGSVLEEQVLEKKILKELRMTGMVLCDPAVVMLMDQRLEGESDLIPVQLKKDGDFSARSAVLTRDQFRLLRSFLRRELVSAGNDIVNGVVDIAPYRQGAHRSCRFCPFKPVCQFDILIEGNTYRLLKSEDRDTIWEKLAKLAGGEKNE